MYNNIYFSIFFFVVLAVSAGAVILAAVDLHRIDKNNNKNK